MGNSFLWVKALHIVFVASWFARLFYLPRFFVNLAMVAIKIAAVLLVIAAGLPHIRPENWRPFMPFGFGGSCMILTPAKCGCTCPQKCCCGSGGKVPRAVVFVNARERIQPRFSVRGVRA